MVHVTRQSRFLLAMVYVFSALLGNTIFAVRVDAESSQVLQGTKPIEWPEEDLSTRLMDRAHAFVERKISEAASQRARYWKTDLSSLNGYLKSLEQNRAELRQILGVVDERLPSRMERYGTTKAPALILETTRFQVYQVRWPIFGQVFGEGLLVSPKTRPSARIVLIPDADQHPEQMLERRVADGSGTSQLCMTLASRNCEVIILQTVSRNALHSENPRLRRARYTEREWIYRQAFHMGRHILGYEIQRVLAAIDWFQQQTPELPIGVAGYGEGGQVAFLSAAVDPRIDVALVSGYFGPREEVWSEPIYRNVWNRLRRFGDAEVAALISPRHLIVEHCRFPTVEDHKGNIATPELERVQQEFERIPRADFLPRHELIGSEVSAETRFSSPALTSFCSKLMLPQPTPVASRLAVAAQERSQEVQQRQLRARDQLEQHVQDLVRNSEHVRDQFFLYRAMPEFSRRAWSTNRQHPVHKSGRFTKSAQSFRKRFYNEAIGQFEEPLVPPNARTRQVAESEDWVAYDVVLDVYQDFFAWGVLVLPKDLKPGERRPVVVCQHGRQGIPRDTIDNHKSAYNDFAAKLAERGFITFAPHNLYRGEDRYRWLDRKANSIGCSLFSFIVPQHAQLLRWLGTLPFVAPDRIAFYGLSYGGETAVRVPTILEGYCLSICSGDFNQWTRKVAATDQPFSFMNTIEWEMPYWNLGHTFDYAEMTYLMVPRPFMVERGHLDGVGRDRWVAHEFAKVRWLYAQLGLADQVEIEFFQGGHSINGEGTFTFLHKHLAWPVPSGASP